MHSQPLTTIVVPVDHTDTSLQALTVAVRLSRQQQTAVHIVYLIEPEGPDAVVADHLSGQAGRSGPFQAEAEELIHSLAAQMAQQYQIPCTGTYRVGHLADEVIKAATEVGASLIVMGTHAGNDWAALRRATDACQLVESAPCPVLTVPEGFDYQGFSRVLFPVRPTPNALAKYAFVRQLLMKHPAKLIVLALFSPDEIISRRQLEEDIIALNAQLDLDGVNSTTHFCPTDLIAETVLEKATELSADLLTITAGPGDNREALFGASFTRQVLHNASLPVLAVRSEPGGQPPVAQGALRMVNG